MINVTIKVINILSPDELKDTKGDFMNTQNLSNLIASKYSIMTNAEKKVADLVLSSPHQAMNSTITDLAHLCGVGETSVFRFCKTLDFNGYQEFRISLALNNSPVSEESSFSDTAAPSGGIQSLAHNVMTAYISAIQKTYASLDLDSIEKAVQLMLEAEFIYFFGVAGSGISAQETHLKFSRIIPNVSFDADLHQQLTKASLAKKGYVGVVFSNSGTTKDAIHIARLFHERDARVIFITENLHTPAAEYSDVLLLSGAAEGPFEGGSITAKTSQLFMMDILYSVFFHKLGTQAKDNKKLTSRVIADKML